MRCGTALIGSLFAVPLPALPLPTADVGDETARRTHKPAPVLSHKALIWPSLLEWLTRGRALAVFSSCVLSPRRARSTIHRPLLPRANSMPALLVKIGECLPGRQWATIEPYIYPKGLAPLPGNCMQAIDIENAIVLPWGLGSRSPHDLFSVCAEIINCPGDIVLDASNLSYIDPLGMATLRALFENQLVQKRVSMQF